MANIKYTDERKREIINLVDETKKRGGSVGILLRDIGVTSGMVSGWRKKLIPVDQNDELIRQCSPKPKSRDNEERKRILAEIARAKLKGEDKTKILKRYGLSWSTVSGWKERLFGDKLITEDEQIVQIVHGQNDKSSPEIKPMTTTVSIEKIKRQGEINQLITEIQIRINSVTRGYEGYIVNGKFKNLGEITRKHQVTLNEIEILLRALNKLDPKHD